MERNHEITGSYNKELAAKCENGTFVGKLNGDILTFKGIPFAEPPVGCLRWKLPQPPKPSDKVFEAYNFGYQSVQPASQFDHTPIESSEDCLTLNVYVNKSDKREKKAVMVWIHGGEFTIGSGSSPSYDCTGFITHIPDIVMVTINYRLGIYGFVDFSTIEGGEAYPDINLALHDQIAALEWVKKNIAAFGGDPECVTIFGESAGAACIGALTVIPEAHGLFKRAIMQSCSVSSATTRKTSTLPAEYLARAFNAKNMEELAAIPEAELKEYWIKNNDSARDYMIMDGRLLRKDPWELYAEGATKDIDLMMGFMKNEWRIFSTMYPTREYFNALSRNMAERAYKAGNDEYKKLYDKYMELVKEQTEPEWIDCEFAGDFYFTCGVDRQAEEHVKNGGKCYMYQMNQKCDIPGFGACHMTDVIYLFGTFSDKGMVKRTPASEALCAVMQEMWSNFAKTGDPSTKEYKWPQYNKQTRTKMILGENTGAADAPGKERRELMQKMFEANPYIRHTGTFTDMAREFAEDHPEMQPEQADR